MYILQYTTHVMHFAPMCHREGEPQGPHACVPSPGGPLSVWRWWPGEGTHMPRVCTDLQQEASSEGPYEAASDTGV